MIEPVQAAVAASLTCGEALLINEVPFAEFREIFLAMDGDERVVLLMSFLQCEQKS
jgi:transcriptional antiterminator RfaH